MVLLAGYYQRRWVQPKQQLHQPLCSADYAAREGSVRVLPSTGAQILKYLGDTEGSPLPSIDFGDGDYYGNGDGDGHSRWAVLMWQDLCDDTEYSEAEPEYYGVLQIDLTSVDPNEWICWDAEQELG